MHNHKTLFNMDISGGMPAVILKMLAESYPGRVVLLPALPREWPSGTVEGILCRGQIEIRRMKWSANKIEVLVISGKPQQVLVEVPCDIESIAAKKGDVAIRKSGDKRSFNVTLPARKAVALTINLK
jgi:hypothetical protein